MRHHMPGCPRPRAAAVPARCAAPPPRTASERSPAGAMRAGGRLRFCALRRASAATTTRHAHCVLVSPVRLKRGQGLPRAYTRQHTRTSNAQARRREHHPSTRPADARRVASAAATDERRGRGDSGAGQGRRQDETSTASQIANTASQIANTTRNNIHAPTGHIHLRSPTKSAPRRRSRPIAVREPRSVSARVAHAEDVGSSCRP
ncbi:hypothetical protein WOLCODRAFT_159211 [Wolfiporia cocos MD-104 SS10]|uniref:Uncharacterized protein n=1 Tax=Wolfiporia cocos (strain MD-104) TaxID=742152 RepID=A0A2H3JBJ0_WOLCO|nr:hypothetical protein WOLCODRAFT_159211 [Wolfiporia cocos MD-104 SS10]